MVPGYPENRWSFRLEYCSTLALSYGITRTLLQELQSVTPLLQNSIVTMGIPLLMFLKPQAHPLRYPKMTAIMVLYHPRPKDLASMEPRRMWAAPCSDSHP
jgi:hypothetical protein